MVKAKLKAKLPTNKILAYEAIYHASLEWKFCLESTHDVSSKGMHLATHPQYFENGLDDTSYVIQVKF